MIAKPSRAAFARGKGSHYKTEFNGNWRPAKQYQNCADMRHSSLRLRPQLVLPPQAEAISFPGIAVHILVEGFSVFGVHVEYWMLVAVLIVAAAVAFDVWRG
jgi:hypothetical protein